MERPNGAFAVRVANLIVRSSRWMLWVVRSSPIKAVVVAAKPLLAEPDAFIPTPGEVGFASQHKSVSSNQIASQHTFHLGTGKREDNNALVRGGAVERRADMVDASLGRIRETAARG